MNFNKLTDLLAKFIATILMPFYIGYKKIKNINKIEFKDKFSIFNKKFKSVFLFFFDYLKENLEKFKNIKVFNRTKRNKSSFLKFKDNSLLFGGRLELIFKYKIQIIMSMVILLSILGVYRYGGFDDSLIVQKSNNELNQNIKENLSKEKSVKDNLTIENSEIALNDLKKIKEYTSDIKSIIDMSYSGYELLVNDNRVGFFKNKSDAQDVLNELKTTVLSKVSGNILETYFKEDVKIIKSYESIVSNKIYADKDNVYNYIVKGTNEEKFHKVKKGENFWTIASKYEITVDSLIKANPDVKPERLQIGQTISLTVPRPLITVLTVEEATYTDDIAYDVKYEAAPSLYKGDYKTKIKGVKGEKEVVAKIVKENGREVGKQILSEKIIKKPSTKVVYKGTKNPPPRIGTGTFMRPTKIGVITSGFGMRRLFGKLGRHNGIDIGIPIGTSVYAADGGIVIRSGWYSGYGLAVIIDHGANMISIYGHNSKLLVKKGDKVFKGQRISLSGNTGRSTGPHLHFEIRKNNVPVDPRKYVKY